MPSRQHWMTAIADEVRERAMLMVDHVATGIVDQTPYGHPPKPPEQPGLDDVMQMDPQTRHAYLASLGPEYGNTVSKLMSEANSRYGAMAAKILPIFQAEELSLQHEQEPGMDQGLGVAAAHAELTDLLGIDPFA